MFSKMLMTNLNHMISFRPDNRLLRENIASLCEKLGKQVLTIFNYSYSHWSFCHSISNITKVYNISQTKKAFILYMFLKARGGVHGHFCMFDSYESTFYR